MDKEVNKQIYNVVKHALQLKESKLIYFRSKECEITVGKVSLRP